MTQYDLELNILQDISNEMLTIVFGDMATVGKYVLQTVDHLAHMHLIGI